MDDKQFVDFIVVTRKEKNISQECMAEILDVSTVTMSGIEQGKTDMDIAMCIKAAEALDIPIEKIFEDAEYPETGKRKKNKVIRAFLVAVMVFAVVNVLVEMMFTWHNRVLMENYRMFTVVSVEDDVLKVKMRSPTDVKDINKIYRIKLDDDLRESFSDIGKGDVLMINYYFEFSDSGVNPSWLIRDLKVDNNLKFW